MKNQTKLFLLIFLLLLTFSIPAFADNTFHNISGEVYFSPDGGCTEAIVNEIRHAKSEIYVQAYSFLYSLPFIIQINGLYLLNQIKIQLLLHFPLRAMKY